MIPICPKCSSQYQERDNFCIQCGKNLMIVKLQKIKEKEKRKNEHKRN